MRDLWRYRVILVEGSIKWMLCINPRGRYDWALPGQRGVRYINYKTAENAEKAIAAMKAADKEPKVYRVAIVRL